MSGEFMYIVLNIHLRSDHLIKNERNSIRAGDSVPFLSTHLEHDTL